MNCLVYARVSTGAQADRHLSIPAQLSAMRTHASHQGWMVLEEFLEAGSSGKTAERPELLRMLERCKSAPHIHVVLVHKIDRLARNLADHLAIRSVLNRANIRLVSVTESLDDSFSGQLVERILASIAEFYSSNLGQEVRKGLTEKVRQGGWPHLQPLGYRRGNPDHLGRRQIELDPAVAPVIREAFERMATGGIGLYELLAWMNTRQVPSSRENLRHLLRNPFYCGQLRWKGQLFAGTHPPLVTPELFDRVQDVLKNRYPGRGRLPKRQLPLLHGVARCVQCNSLMTSERHEPHEYYRCRRTFKTPRCHAHFANALHIHASLFELYQRLKCTSEIKARFREVISRRVAGIRAGQRWTEQWRAFATEGRRAAEARLAEGLTAGTLSPRLQEMVRRLGNDIDEITAESPQPQEVPSIDADSAVTVWDLHCRLTPADQRVLVECVFSRIRIERVGIADYVLQDERDEKAA